MRHRLTKAAIPFHTGGAVVMWQQKLRTKENLHEL